MRGQKTSQEVSFSIKKSFGSRKGWKIMPDDEQQNIDASALKSVVSIIKDMELNVSIQENYLKRSSIFDAPI